MPRSIDHSHAAKAAHALSKGFKALAKVKDAELVEQQLAMLEAFLRERGRPVKRASADELSPMMLAAHVGDAFREAFHLLGKLMDVAPELAATPIAMLKAQVDSIPAGHAGANVDDGRN